MSLLTLILVIILAGVGLFLADRYLPMEAGTKTILKIVVIGVLVVFVLQFFGVITALQGITGH